LSICLRGVVMPFLPVLPEEQASAVAMCHTIY
jgi:hypothetical protein